MSRETMSQSIKRALSRAARTLGTADPVPWVGGLLDRSFSLPAGAPEYARNTLSPGTVAFEPSFSEREAGAVRFTLEPLAGASPLSRQHEATREMRRIVGPCFGGDALSWFDERSEEWRGISTRPGSSYGAWFGAAFDSDGPSSAKVYYELNPGSLEALPLSLRALAQIASELLPGLVPIFTSIRCGRKCGGQRVTFFCPRPLRVVDLGPLMDRLGMGEHLSSVMQVVGVALGGRFELPERSVLLGLSETGEGPELKLEILLGRLPDIPASFLELVRLALAERPRERNALGRWVDAFTPGDVDSPGDFSVLSIRTTPQTPARVNLYLRPAEFMLQPGALGGGSFVEREGRRLSVS